MTDQSRGDGRFAAERPDEGFVSAIGELAPTGTGEVAEDVGCSRQDADYRLRKLRERGEVGSKEVGRDLAGTPRGGD